jgi:lipoprotein-anchoring transpeptidase ErfK/SrfK
MTRPVDPSRHATGAVHSCLRRRDAAVLLSALLMAVTACTSEAREAEVTDEPQAAASSPTAGPAPEPQAEVTVSPAGRRGVPVDTVVGVLAESGELTRVRVTSPEGRLRGEVSGDGDRWTATDRLEPGLRYEVLAVAVDENGLRTRERSRFHTEDLSLAQQTFPSIAPLEGETVGVGMPVIVQFDIPVTRRAAIERHLSVETAPRQQGSWHWVNDNEVHWRPRTYWKPGTRVTVDADINSVHAGSGVYGQVSREVSFEVGDAVISKVDVANYRMQVFVNGSLARTMAISAGKPGFITRSGTKVIIEKVRDKVMDAATLGIPESDPEYYRLDVEYAMRVTYSGEFLHAAPWSADSQGFANVSHGCVGMTTDNAAWLFDITKRGDVVEVIGSDRYMSLYNGYGDWNASFEEYAEGSALS